MERRNFKMETISISISQRGIKFQSFYRMPDFETHFAKIRSAIHWLFCRNFQVNSALQGKPNNLEFLLMIGNFIHRIFEMIISEPFHSLFLFLKEKPVRKHRVLIHQFFTRKLLCDFFTMGNTKMIFFCLKNIPESHHNHLRPYTQVKEKKITSHNNKQEYFSRRKFGIHLANSRICNYISTYKNLLTPTIPTNTHESLLQHLSRY